MYATLLALLLCTAPTEATDTVVVCPPEFQQSLHPWLVYRGRQGHRMALVSNAESADEIRLKIREVARTGALRSVVLVGDSVANVGVDAPFSNGSVPTHLAKAKVNVRWGSEPEIATDNWYADLDDDAIPDLAIGRLSVATNDELAVIISKIISYEQQASYRAWRRQVNLVAGVGGFGRVIDSVLEHAAKKLFTDSIPSAYEATMTYGSWHSPYCPDPRQFHRATIDRFNEGSLFWVYMGHGQPYRLDEVRVPGGRFHILGTWDMEKLCCAQGLPIAVLLACYCGAFDQPQNCLGEEMLRAEGGPVAVFCGSRVTMPYAMSVLCHELMDEFFQHRRETLGEVLLNAKRRMVAGQNPEDKSKVTHRQMIEAIASALSPSADLLREERAEHLLLFNLLGDPLLRLQHPQPVPLSTAKTVEAGQRLEVVGECPVSGRCTVELVSRRDRIRFTPPVRQRFDGSDEALAEYTTVYQQANDARWTARSLNVEAGKFRTLLSVPDEAHGPSHVRVFLEGDGSFAMGSTNVFVRRPSVNQKP